MSYQSIKITKERIMRMKENRAGELLSYLPASIAKRLENILTDEWIDVEEIRLRAEEPLAIGVFGESCFITDNGGITNYESDAYKVKSEEVGTAFGKICENSVYAHLEEIQKGYITLKGGHRVGICGKAVCECGKIKNFKEVSSLNFRVAHQVIGFADGIIDSIINGSSVSSTLIVAEPQMGKTTLLRDIARQVSNKGFKCGIADDRGELAAMFNGVPSNDVGAQTDVIDGAKKNDAIEMLIRTMSPNVLISDEIASESEVNAILLAAGTGVKVIASAHGSSVEEVLSKKSLKRLFCDKVFEQIILLKRDFLSPDSVIYTKVVKL